MDHFFQINISLPTSPAFIDLLASTTVEKSCKSISVLLSLASLSAAAARQARGVQ
jgi:hypothetical protein